MSTDERTNEHTTAIKAILFEDKVQDLKELPSNITTLFEVQFPYINIDKFVTAVQEYAITNILSIFDIETIDESDEETIEIIQSLVRDILTKYITKFIEDQMRKRVVQYHAQGCTTTEVVNNFIDDHPSMRRLAKDDALGIQKLRRLLVQRLAYLKPGHPSWPEEKYGSLWREARNTKIEETTNLTLTNSAEQVSVLVDNVKQMQSALENEDISPRDIQLITNSITRTIQALNKITMSDK